MNIEGADFGEENRPSTGGGLVGRVLYALLFVLALPLGLVAWARRIEALGVGPAIKSQSGGALLAIAGMSLIGSGWWALYRYGGGLPMNAFPPPRQVSCGIYRFLSHPIYDGAVLVATGAALLTGSASGLWIVTPLLALATAALVLGYERPDLIARFGSSPTGLEAPVATPGVPTVRERASYLLHAISPWVVWILAGALFIGSPPSVIVMAPLAVILAVPVFVASRPFLARAWHIARRALVANILLAFLTGPLSSELVLVRLGIALLLGAVSGRLWEAARAISETIANSWREWRIGPVRIINHAVVAWLSTVGGVFIVSALVGPTGRSAVVAACLGGLVGAGLWAQIIEGSARLSRPYGFYGGVLGIIIVSCIAAPIMDTSRWLLLAAFTTAAPFIQSVGRVRCLVQGCCHGHPAPISIGIRHTHARSRVVRLSTLAGVPVHPTALYSILWNGVIAIVLARGWSQAFPLHAIGGLYLVLGGLGRFVEEAYRGEPQTPEILGLRLYQWTAIISVIAGVVCMSLGSSGPAPSPAWASADIIGALALGLVVGAAMGVDFPESDRRLSRLA
jgi:prolipoprotein diacylglyceryltransferase/protein-S-isoprenylcysteine O-methyltransferase Ste14